MQQVYIISDGTGGTAEKVLNAAITQFGDQQVNVKIFPDVFEWDQVNNIIVEAANENALIIHTVVSQELRKTITRTARLHDIKAIDLMGPMLINLSRMFSYSPLEEPGLFRKINIEYFQRIEAMEFAFRHDDGQRLDELSKDPICLKYPVQAY